MGTLRPSSQRRRLPSLSDMVLSNKFYNNLFDVAPGTLRRDTTGLSAVCLLPPKVKVQGRVHPKSAISAIRRETPSGPPYGRSMPRPKSAAPSRSGDLNWCSGEISQEVQPQPRPSSRRGRPQSAKARLTTAPNNQTKGFQGKTAEEHRVTPLGTTFDSRPSTADSFEDKIRHYRKQPVSDSRKCWNRINPGHMLNEWDSTNRKTQNPDFGVQPYKFEKEFHLPKTDIMTYVNDMIRMKVSIKTGFR